MRAYVIRVYFEDGNWFYAQNEGYGEVRVLLTKDVACAICFETQREAWDYFNSYIRGTYDKATGLKVNNSRCALIEVEY